MKSVNAGMLTYPIHQACDILFCKGNVVPVGKDQLPHIELTRTIARKQGNMTKDMTKGNPLSLIVQFSLPLLAGNVFQQAYNMVVSTYAGQNYGAQDFARIKKGLRQGLLLSFGFAVFFLCPMLVIFARPLSLLFIPATETAVLDASEYFIRLAGYFFWLISLLQTLRLTIQALKFPTLRFSQGFLR